ncbi:hypothetical protein FGG08_006785 [Glutinoglossum americanum]|uniref:Protein kinase domain-containing protein n=1 Tax=Glutinoglossum americanum TaxID=1670608 RepID=A0A9P8I0K4_9PEZI|nr:hypothetical protein FGG08_006785 [Glutinoglossum americanum]
MTPEAGPHMAGDEGGEIGSQTLEGPFTPLVEKLSDFFSRLNDPNVAVQVRFTDLDIQQISDLLYHINARWSSVPRLYIVLRAIGQLQLLDAFIAQGMTDLWFPFSEITLPSVIGVEASTRFIEAQTLVLTRAIDLEKSGNHQSFGKGDLLPFLSLCEIGEGTYGVVDKVVSRTSRKEYARKRLHRERNFGRQQEKMKRIAKELELLKRLQPHRHIVRLVGSYTDPTFVGLIMSPVADCNLAAFLASPVHTAERKSVLHSFFGCLSKALQFLHGINIRHKDVKPENILIKGETVLITDFGISMYWEGSGQGGTQSSVVLATPRYRAPEFDEENERNTSSDIWSLGCVFLEMVTVLKGRAIPIMRAFLSHRGTKIGSFARNLDATKDWVGMLRAGEGTELDIIPLEWIRHMLQPDRNLRPKAEAVTDMILSSGSLAGSCGIFCGACCTEDRMDPGDEGATIQRGGKDRAAPPPSIQRPAKSGSNVGTDPVVGLSPSTEGNQQIQIRSKPKVNRRSDIRSTISLFKAIEEDDTERVRSLLEAGVDLSAQNPQGRSPIMRAAEIGQAAAAKLLLENGADVNARGIGGTNALYMAVYYRHGLLTEMLLENGAKPNVLIQHMALLQIAVNNGDEGITRTLLGKGAEPDFRSEHGPTALFLAVEIGSEEIATLLLKAGADVNARFEHGTPLRAAVERDHEGLTRLLLENGADPNAETENELRSLHIAARSGHEGIAKHLLKYGAEVDITERSGSTPLFLAAAWGHQSLVEILLDAGADVNACNDRKATSLHAAAERGQEAATALLIERGASLADVTDIGWGALHLAARYGHESVARLLLEMGGDLNARDTRLWTSLHLAAEYGHQSITVLLLENGVDINSQNVDGRTALHIAAAVGCEEIVGFLITQGANVDCLDLAGQTAFELALWNQQEGVANILEPFLECQAD